jgi:parallel beta-helix repeat protein
MTRKRNRPVSRPAGKRSNVRPARPRKAAKAATGRAAKPAPGSNKAKLREMREKLMAQRSAKGSPRRKAMESRKSNQMSRSQFLRTAGIAGAGLGAAAVGLGGVAKAHIAPEHVHFPSEHSTLLAAIEAAGINGTIIVDAGTHDLPRTTDLYEGYFLLEGQTIIGEGFDADGKPVSKLRFSDDYTYKDGWIFGLVTAANDVTIEGLGFEQLDIDLTCPVLAFGAIGGSMITNAIIKDNHIANFGHFAIYMSNCTDSLASGNVIENIVIGMYISDYPTGVPARNTTVSGNRIVNATNYGIYLDGGTGNPTSGNTVSGNDISIQAREVGSRGIYLPFADDNEVTGNTINMQNGQGGMDLSYSNNNTITGNTISGTFGSGIIARGSSYNEISQNTMNMVDYVFAGISISDGSDGNTLQGNKLSGTVGHPIYIELGSNNVLLGNNLSGVTELKYKNPDYNPFCFDEAGEPKPGQIFSEPVMEVPVPHTGFGNALDFRAGEFNDNVVVPDHESLRIANNITVTAWVYPDDVGNWRTIVGKMSHGHGGANPSHPDLYLAIAENQIFFALYNNAVPSNYIWWDYSGVPIAAGEWSHVALTYDDSTKMAKVYKNGILEADFPNELTASGLALAINENPLHIGNNDAWGEYFVGRIDDVAIWDRALNEAEISDLGNQEDPDFPKYPNDPSLSSGLVAYYSCDSINDANPLHLLPESSVPPKSALDGEINKQSCPPLGELPDVYSPTLPGVNAFLGPSATFNTLKGNFGESVIDEPDYQSERVVFGCLDDVHEFYGYWAIEASKAVFVDNGFGDAGYGPERLPSTDPNANLADPNYFERQEYHAFPYLFGPVYQRYAIGTVADVPDKNNLPQLYNLALTETLVPATNPYCDPVDVPQSNGIAVVLPKDNYITGFESMAGAGGIGPQVSTANMSPKWQAWKQSLDVFLATNPTEEEMGEWLAANPEPPRQTQPPKHDKPPKHEHEEW